MSIEQPVRRRVEAVTDTLFRVYRRVNPPNPTDLLPVVGRAIETLRSEPPTIRPADSSGLPGGLVLLDHELPTVVIPDLHARRELILNLMLQTDVTGYTNLDKLSLGLIQIVFVGDGFHSEGRQRKRWERALEEYKGLYKRRRYMDEEMRDSFGVMEMVMELKSTFPDHIHFLKGNHENIANEEGGGNHPFRKYALEGPMVFEYVKRFMGDDLLDRYYHLEKEFPLLAVGRNFMISHSEPATFYGRDEVVEYRAGAEVVEGLTWTPNDGSEPGTVSRMIEAYIDDEYRAEALYFGGHRPVSGFYNLRDEGRYVQIHNPDRFLMTVIKPNRPVDLEADIVEMADRTDDILRLYA